MTDKLDEDHSNPTKPLHGLRLLVVEDQFFVAMEGLAASARKSSAHKVF
jgi:hypothetical protein